jgi:MFS transporter, FSR family, fosmidomycin resistance protein
VRSRNFSNENDAMTNATPLTLPAARAGEFRTIFSVSVAHFVSHYYGLLLPPLFAFVRSDYGVSYMELGLALAAFNIVSAAFQTPAGFLVDRLGARTILVGGLLLGACGFAIVAAVDSYWVLVAMFAVAGLGNTVYHPADYAILSDHITADRIGRAFSVHTFAGMLGSAVAPASLLFLQGFVGWRGAFLVAAALGLVAAALIAIQRDDARPHGFAQVKQFGSDRGSWQVLLSPAILRNFAFFTLLAVIGGGIQNYSVVALASLHGTPLALANAALTAYLLVCAAGILVGGVLVGRVSNLLVATLGTLVTGLTVLLLGLAELGPLLLLLTMSIGGFATGVAMPSRDMIVRAVTPNGSFGKVFGFVSTGFNVSGIFAPLVFGALMDSGKPRAVFLLVAASCVVAMLTVVGGSRPVRAV